MCRYAEDEQTHFCFYNISRVMQTRVIMCNLRYNSHLHKCTRRWLVNVRFTESNNICVKRLHAFNRSENVCRLWKSLLPSNSEYIMFMMNNKREFFRETTLFFFNLNKYGEQENRGMFAFKSFIVTNNIHLTQPFEQEIWATNIQIQVKE